MNYDIIVERSFQYEKDGIRYQNWADGQFQIIRIEHENVVTPADIKYYARQCHVMKECLLLDWDEKQFKAYNEIKTWEQAFKQCGIKMFGGNQEYHKLKPIHSFVRLFYNGNQTVAMFQDEKYHYFVGDEGS